MTKHRFNVSVTTDEDTGKLVAAYLRIRDGKSVKTVEVEEDRAYADYDAEGQLIGVELLAPCQVKKIMDLIATEEPQEVREFFRSSPPSSMVLV